MSARAVSATWRWGRFNLVGLGGFVLQLLALSILTRRFGWHPTLATAVGLQVAVLHNFAGHSLWTWADRRAVDFRVVARRFGRYQAAKAVSLAANAGLTTWLVWSLWIPVELANAAAVAVLSIANFLVTDRFVFQSPREQAVHVCGFRPYVQLVKFRYHITFLNVLFGALLFAPAYDFGLGARLAALYVSFNVLLYGGLYTLNDLADCVADRHHPQKRLRPVASGAVTTSHAAWYAGVLIAAGLATGVVFGAQVWSCYLAVVAINATYSVGGRDLRGADLLLNSLPHVVRFLMGVLVVGEQPPVGHLIALLCMAMALSSLRRDVEKDVDRAGSRPTLLRYSGSQLRGVVAICLGTGLVVALHGMARAPGFYGVLWATTAVLIGGAYLSETVRDLLRRIWTH
jgi:4-hydroxybenzoate polyprenyltransferase